MCSELVSSLQNQDYSADCDSLSKKILMSQCVQNVSQNEGSVLHYIILA